MNDWEGQSIRLRAVEPGDAALFYRWNQDSQRSRNLDFVWPPTSLAAVEQWAAEQSRKRLDGDSYHWVIETLDGEPVGSISTHNCNPRAGTFSYGVDIASEHRGKGYASAAIRLVLAYYFFELRYQKCTVSVHSSNHASIHLHEKLDFQKEGVLRRMIFTRGRFFDEVWYGITLEEFLKGEAVREEQEAAETAEPENTPAPADFLVEAELPLDTDLFQEVHAVPEPELAPEPVLDLEPEPTPEVDLPQEPVEEPASIQDLPVPLVIALEEDAPLTPLMEEAFDLPVVEETPADFTPVEPTPAEVETWVEEMASQEPEPSPEIAAESPLELEFEPEPAAQAVSTPFEDLASTEVESELETEDEAADEEFVTAEQERIESLTGKYIENELASFLMEVPVEPPHANGALPEETPLESFEAQLPAEAPVDQAPAEPEISLEPDILADLRIPAEPAAPAPAEPEPWTAPETKPEGSHTLPPTTPLSKSIAWYTGQRKDPAQRGSPAEAEFLAVVQSAEDAFNHGNLSGALELYNQALELYPNHPATLSARGRVKAELGDLPGALVDFSQSLQLFSYQPDTLVQRAVVRTRAGDLFGALLDYDLAIEQNPENMPLYPQRGGVKLSLGDYDGALHDYDRFLEANPGNIPVLLDRAQVKAEVGNWASALADCERVLQSSPREPRALAQRSAVKMAQGDLAAAWLDAAKAIQANPNIGLPYYTLACVATRKGQFPVAMDQLRKALSLDPDLADSARRDPNLARLRETAEFMALL